MTQLGQVFRMAAKRMEGEPGDNRSIRDEKGSNYGCCRAIEKVCIDLGAEELEREAHRLLVEFFCPQAGEPRYGCDYWWGDDEGEQDWGDEFFAAHRDERVLALCLLAAIVDDEEVANAAS